MSARKPLYQRIIAHDWVKLDPQVQELHLGASKATWTGRFTVEHGKSLLSRLTLRLFGLPPAGADIPVRLTVTSSDSGETWERHFADKRFTTRQYENPGRLLGEAIGVLRISYRLLVADGRLSHHRRDVRIQLKGLSAPVPGWLAPQIRGEERGLEDGTGIWVSVSASHRLLGELITYQGRIS